MDARDARRVKDLKSALKRAKPDDLLALDHLARMWGVSKPRFVTIQKDMIDFPEPQQAPKEMGLNANSHVYAARAAIESMIAFATRHEDSARAKADRTNAILGRARDGDHPESMHTPNELAVLSRLKAEIEERERAQRLYIPAAEVAAVAGDVFAEISEFVESLPNAIDPHGALPADKRGEVLELGRERLLRLHSRMKHILTPDVVADRNRDTTDRARKPRARRARG